MRQQNVFAILMVLLLSVNSFAEDLLIKAPGKRQTDQREARLSEGVLSSRGDLPADRSIKPYVPSAENLAAREKFQRDKFGIFIHWGVYSVLAKGEWVMHLDKMTVEEYKPVAKKFNPTKYDPAAWVALFKKAGAKYITITSKHHDGFALWDTDQSDWNVVDATPYGKDLLKPLAEECEKQGIDLFFYHSHLDWTHPDYFPRGRTGKHSGRPQAGDFDKYLDFMDAQLAELLSGDYGRVNGIWFDGWWDQQKRDRYRKKNLNTDPKVTYVDWRLQQTYDRIHALQAACLIGNNHHVLPFAGEDFQMFERDLPGKNKAGFSADARRGNLPLETCDTINKSWGYNAGDKKVKSTKQLVHYLVKAAGRGANLLLNVGPKPDGTIQSEFVDRLTKMGEWLDTHGETIYGTTAGPIEPQVWGVSTRRRNEVFLHVLKTPPTSPDGWATLVGTARFRPVTLKIFGGDVDVPHRTTESGELQVQLPTGEDPIDTVLLATVAE